MDRTAAPRALSGSGKGALMAPRHQADRMVADGVDAGLAAALREVGQELDVLGLEGGERNRLLQRQAELGDLRDERALRARRRLSA